MFIVSLEAREFIPGQFTAEEKQQVKKSGYGKLMGLALIIAGGLIGWGGATLMHPLSANPTHYNVSQNTLSKNVKQVKSAYPNFAFPDQKNENRAASLRSNLIGNSFYVVDTDTGVEYIVTAKGGITPRLNNHGQVVVAKNLKK